MSLNLTTKKIRMNFDHTMLDFCLLELLGFFEAHGQHYKCIGERIWYSIMHLITEITNIYKYETCYTTIVSQIYYK